MEESLLNFHLIYIILEIKISVVELNRNRRIEGTQERISRLDDRIIEIIQSKQQTEVV